MKTSILFLLGLLSLHCLADPFYAEPAPSQAIDIFEKNTHEENALVQEMKFDACTGSEKHQAIHLGVEFSSLKLVGIVQFNQHYRALFFDNHRIIDLKIHDLLVPENIEITDITLKEVHYIAWKNVTDCDHPIISTLKF